MNGLDMLDVAIGTVFVFLLLSLICTAVNEIIESILKRRAAELERGIGELLSKQGAVDYGNIVAAIYNHPLISSLYKGADYKTAKKNNDLPSYIPTRNFALALLDIVTPVNKETAEKQQHLPPGSTESFSPDLNTNQVTQIAPAIDSALAGNRATTTTTAPVPDSATFKGHTLDTVHNTVDQIKNDTIKRGLLPLIDAAENDVDRLRANIEDWYNSTMDRVSGWYKRRTQWIMIVLGLAVAIIVNADTISIVNSLTHDPAARNSLVAASQEYAKTEAAAVGNKDDGTVETAKTRLDKNLTEIKSLGLPIGWNRSDPRSVPQTDEAWLLKILGWLITATAVSLGAPFWFDVLNKFMVVRSTVKPKEKSKEEGQKDAKK